MRLSPLTPDYLTDKQQDVLNQMTNSPRSKGFKDLTSTGPFAAWLRAPGIGTPTNALGAVVRYKTSLSDSVKEVATCTVGAFYKAKFEFAVHGKMALAAGVEKEAVEAIRRGDTPDLAGDEATAYSITKELLNAHHIAPATFQAGLLAFGEEGLIELVTTVGYYCLISHTLNAFEIGLPDDMEDPFPN